MTEVKSILERLKKEEFILFNRAEELGVDVREIIKQMVEKFGEKYSEKTVYTKCRAEIRRAVKKASATTVKGLIAGCYDVSGFRFPIRFILARKSGEHVVFSNFGMHVNNKEIIVPSLAEVQLEEGDYGYTLVDGSFKPVKPESVGEKLVEVAVPVQEIDEHYDEHDERSPVVIVGKIASVVPRTRFEEKEPVGYHPVQCPDEREPEPEQYYPVMEILLERHEHVRCRVILEKQRYGRPIYLIEDLHLLCDDASQLSDPVEQAQYVSDGLEGRWIVVVGVLSRYQKTRLDSGEDADFVDVVAGGIYEIEYTPEFKEPEKSDTEAKAELDAKQEEETEEVIDMTKEVETIVEKYQWKPQTAKELDKLCFESKGLPPAVKCQGGETDGAYICDGQFMDGTVAAIKLEGESVFVWCSKCGTDDCKHILSLWYPFAREKYTKMQPLPKKTKKQELFREERKEKEEVDESAFNRVYTVVRAYVRGGFAKPEDLNEGLVMEKLNIRDVPTSVIRAVIRKIREEGVE